MPRCRLFLCQDTEAKQQEGNIKQATAQVVKNLTDSISFHWEAGIRALDLATGNLNRLCSQWGRRTEVVATGGMSSEIGVRVPKTRGRSFLSHAHQHGPSH